LLLFVRGLVISEHRASNRDARCSEAAIEIL
jgi:hypothetical protein